jgi:hypothetical protein
MSWEQHGLILSSSFSLYTFLLPSIVMAYLRGGAPGEGCYPRGPALEGLGVVQPGRHHWGLHRRGVVVVHR